MEFLAGRRLPVLLRRADDDALGRGDPRLRRRRREEGRRGALSGPGRPRQREGRRRQHHRRLRADPGAGRQGRRRTPRPRSRGVVPYEARRPGVRLRKRVDGPACGRLPSRNAPNWSSGLLLAGLLLAVASRCVCGRPRAPAAAPDGAFVEEAVGAYLGRPEAAEASDPRDARGRGASRLSGASPRARPALGPEVVLG